MTDLQMTSNVEVLKEYYTMHFPEVKWHEMSSQEIIDQYAPSHQEELKKSFLQYPLVKQTLEAFCKCEVFYLHQGFFDDTLLKNLANQKLSYQNLEKFSTLLEITEKSNLPVEIKTKLRSLTDETLNNIDKDTVQDLLLQDSENQNLRLKNLLK